MESLKMIFFDDYVAIKDKKYNDIDKVFKFIIDEKRNSRKFSIIKKQNELHKDYVLSIDETDIHAIFSITNNNEYTEILERWYDNDRKFRIAKLKFITGLLVSSITAGAFVSCHSKVIGKIKEEIGFYIENINELHSISVLEEEIKGHSGYGEIDGYRQTIEDHNNSHCALGENIKYSSMEDEINEFCIEHNLGVQVSKYAYEKFELLYNDETKEAYEINLKEIYKENQKVHKKLNNQN